MDTSIKTIANIVPAALRPVPTGRDEGGKALPAEGKIAPLRAAADKEKASATPPASATKESEKIDLADRVKLSKQAAERLNEALKERQRDLEFSVDETTGRTVLKVIHSESGEVIRQLPPEEILQIARAFIEGTGSLIDDEA